MPEDRRGDSGAQRTRARVAAALFAMISAVTAVLLGESYIGRLPNHAGYFLVPVHDEVRVPIPTRPRHTVVIVVDGLRLDAAITMASAGVLLRAGQCRVSDQGTYTVSRPEYALLSTGLEVDRTGARNNDLTTPLAAESIWQIARESGLRVEGSSHLPWFKQLFPEGFDRFSVPRSHADNVFDIGDGELADLTLVHPLYVDEVAHHHGGASKEYAAAVARVDTEISGLLARLDLSQDLVLLTADHGHRDEGGHGGGQPEIRNVLACFAGANVARLEGRAAFDGRSTAPALALLLGLRFPQHMRAGDDGLDVLWDITRADAPNLAYLTDRRAAVARFRDENRRALEGWLGGSPGTWPRLYARGEKEQAMRALLVLLTAALGLALRLRHTGRDGEGGRRARAASIGFIAAVAVVLWATHHAILGDFDYSVINLREPFLLRGFSVTALSVCVSIGGHWAMFRRRDRLAADMLTALGLLLTANVGHMFVYGWPLGFPLPCAAARYLPFFGAIALFGYAVAAFALVIVGARVPSSAQRTKS